MRRFTLLAGLCLLAVACGDESTFETATTASPTSTSTTPLTASSTTSTPTTVSTTTTSTVPETTTTTWATFAVPAVDLCVIDHLSDDALNVRSGPGAAFGVIGTLAYDATGVHATGVAAADAEGRTWKQIDYPGGPGLDSGLAGHRPRLHPRRARRVLPRRTFVRPEPPQGVEWPRACLFGTGEPALERVPRRHRGLVGRHR